MKDGLDLDAGQDDLDPDDPLTPHLPPTPAF